MARSNITSIISGPNKNVIYCDWRLKVRNCFNSTTVTWLYTVNVVMSSVVIIIGSWILYRRLMRNGRSLQNPDRAGLLRPRPVEFFLTCLITFHLECTVVNIVMLTDAFPSNLINELLWELPWSALFAAVTFYVVGIIGSIPRTSFAIARTRTAWLPSTDTVDVIGLFMVFGPIVTNLTLAILSGYYSDMENLFMATLFIKIHYSFSTFWCMVLFILISFFGWKLTSIIGGHLSHFNDHNIEDTTVLKTGLMKLRTILFEIAATLMYFAVNMALYVRYRESILTSRLTSNIAAFMWLLPVPVLALGGLFVVMIEPWSKCFPEQESIPRDSRPSKTTQSMIQKTGESPLSSQESRALSNDRWTRQSYPNIRIPDEVDEVDEVNEMAGTVIHEPPIPFRFPLHIPPPPTSDPPTLHGC